MSRLIEYEPNTRTKPMRVLCMAMQIALRQLGLNPYHGSECFNNPPRDFNLWIEAMQCNFFNDGTKKRYGREEFDRLMGSYDACLDIPACIFWEDLHRAYPDAKVIVTTRDVDSWLKSVNATVFKFIQMPIFKVWQFIDYSKIGPLFRMSEMVWKVFCGGCYEDEVCRKAYLEHHEKIRKTIPKEQLLEFRIGKDGWKELCEFLGEPVPQEKWPKAYPTAEFQEHIDMGAKEAKRKIGRWMGIGAMVGAVGLLVQYSHAFRVGN
ncbi:hypothetical protein MW887_007217 [Aspergillus wentii]|nr:hypothetical protein MW887_007217 [Aspergillus wentii]